MKYTLILLVCIASVAAIKLPVKKNLFSECRNTIETTFNVSDDKGYLCTRQKLNYKTGCCPNDTSFQYECSSCTERGCCSTYAGCVSCCLGAQSVQGAYADALVFRIYGHPETGHWTDQWEYCTGQCRVDRHRTIGESRYRSVNKYCYSKEHTSTFDENPDDHSPQHAHFPDHIHFKVAPPNQNCIDACRADGKECSKDKLDYYAGHHCEVFSQKVGFKCRFCRPQSKYGQTSGTTKILPKDGILPFNGDCYESKGMEPDCNQKSSIHEKIVCRCV